MSRATGLSFSGGVFASPTDSLLARERREREFPPERVAWKRLLRKSEREKERERERKREVAVADLRCLL